MLNILTRIADRYTDEVDATPELTMAHFVAGIAERYAEAALEIAAHDPGAH